ncbi:dTDP-4-dehydrorhamnose reductase [Mesorhizobium sp. LHD-90]|nr:dTDP-4-dehydrorhamnose reductase [Mesorhizobium sp. LHD-90]MDQ6437388.1 dTDP-4-dehydrorhamnose reductase [Mesorhizobium sp. LHD-90]
MRWPEEVGIVAPARGELDLCDANAVGRLIADHAVSAIINAAAYTAVDKAEKDVAAAFAANTLIPAALAQATCLAGIPLIHISTDYVFDGNATGAYEVDAPLNPLGVYGASKAAGEWAVRLGNPRSAVVRTSWVVSARRSNFVRTMLRLGFERDVVRVVQDQHGSPTLAADLAEALSVITMRMIADRHAPTDVFHFTNEGPTTWHDFAAAIFATCREAGYPVPKLEAIGSADYPTPARRPANSVLSTARIERDYGLKPASWRERLPMLVREILSKGL